MILSYLTTAILFGILLLGKVFASSGITTAPSSFLPKFTAKLPNSSKPLGGYTRIKQEFPPINIAYGSEKIGKYNHNVMFNYDIHVGFYIYWKNGILQEDSNGQRILFSASKTPHAYTKARVLFPNLTIGNVPCSLEPSPSIQINGHVYATASPAFINYTLKDLHVAQGAQCQLWPDSIDPRNCGPSASYAVEYKHTLLLRRIYSNFTLGPMFWGSYDAPEIFSIQTKTFDIQTFTKNMDETTYEDLKDILKSNNVNPPCNTFESGSMKCEWCKGGCMLYDTIPFDLKITNERAHYKFNFNSYANYMYKNTNIKYNGGDNNIGDVLLYRSENTKHILYASIRLNNSYNQNDWSELYETNIPNDNTNLNAGTLNDGKVYLAFNPVVRDEKTLHRDPLCISTSNDGGAHFNKIGVALTCHDLPRGDASSSCKPLFNHNVNYGVSYPQVLQVVQPAPEDHQGLYIAASNNKEDIWIVKLNSDDV